MSRRPPASEVFSPTRHLWLALGALSATVIFAAVSLDAGRGELVPPLDDTYIHLEYARNLARGVGLVFQAGGGFSTGDTAPLYVALLAPAYWIGLDGWLALIWVFALNGLLLYAVAALGVRLVASKTESLAARWTALLLLLFWGPWLWGVFCGMEVALTAFLLLVIVTGTAREAETPTSTWRWWRRGALVALPLVRPEGLFLAGLAILVGAAAGEVRWRARLKRVLGELVLLAPFAAYLVANAIATGSFLTTGYLVKAASVSPDLGPTGLLGHTARWIDTILSHLFLSASSEYLPPLAALWLVAALGPRIAAEWRRRRPGQGSAGLQPGVATLIAVFWLADVVLASQAWFPDSQRNRYLLPLFPLYLVAFALVVGDAVRWMRRHQGVKVLAGVVVVAWLVPSPARWVDHYASDAREIAAIHVRLARWIDVNLPRDAILGVHDAGAMVYLTERPAVDLVGLGTPAFAEPFRNGDGSVVEAIERLAPEDRPSYYAIAPRWFRAPILGQQVAQASIPEAYMVAESTYRIRRADYSAMPTGPLRPFRLDPGSLRIVDDLDVADVVSESAHRYENRFRLRTLQSDNIAETFSDGDQRVVDGGRLIFAEERFRIAVEPGRPFYIVGRLAAADRELPEVALALSDGQATLLSAAGVEGQVVAPFPPTDEREVWVTATPHDGAPYYSFHYWVLQPPNREP